MTSTFFSSVIAMLGLSVFFSVVLAVADRYLRVEEDPRTEKVEHILPGLNCGACGFPNCRAMAEAMVKGEVAPAGCPVAGEDAAKLIAGFLGLEAGKVTKKLAIVHCGADVSQRRKKANYSGIQTCGAADTVFWGGLECRFGCLGFGNCAGSCPFDAIKMVNGLPKVDPEECTACGKCMAACPRTIISLEPFEKKEITFVACSSVDKGALVKKICPVGCIACRVCEKLSKGVFEVKENIAKVDYKKAAPDTNWGLCAEKCPTKTIQKITKRG